MLREESKELIYSKLWYLGKAMSIVIVLIILHKERPLGKWHSNRQSNECLLQTFSVIEIN